MDMSLGRKLAEEHVDWFLETIRPLLIEFMTHGYKHGTKDKKNLFQEEEEGFIRMNPEVIT